jgi:hypothetical protein
MERYSGDKTMLQMLRVMVLTLSCVLAVLPRVSLAGEVAAGQEGSTVWRAGIDGVEIEWNGDGTFKRIYSQMTHPVRFPDKQGIAKAQAIAEERAKAAIIRFLDQTVATATFVSEVDNDIEQATRTQGSDDKEAITKTNKRVMIETLGQVAGSAAAGRLKGVIILERGYDEKREEAWARRSRERGSQSTTRKKNRKDSLQRAETWAFLTREAKSKNRNRRIGNNRLSTRAGQVQRAEIGFLRLMMPFILCSPVSLVSADSAKWAEHKLAPGQFVPLDEERVRKSEVISRRSLLRMFFAGGPVEDCYLQCQWHQRSARQLAALT